MYFRVTHFDCLINLEKLLGTTYTVNRKISIFLLLKLSSVHVCMIKFNNLIKFVVDVSHFRPSVTNKLRGYSIRDRMIQIFFCKYKIENLKDYRGNEIRLYF